MTSFAFYGRVSTEDQQDPASSLAWQLTRARALTDTHGEIVTEYFDIGQSRSIPWKRRPQAALLLAALRDPGRGFDAVVIGEPHRAFYGNQYSLVHPVFEHYGVAFWVPEVGGPIDPTSEAHDLIMSVFGGMSKGERNRIKIRVRTAMAAQAKTEGRYLGGRPPYGYRIADAGPHPNPAKAADGKRLHVLEPDPVTSPITARIFREYAAGRGLYAIAEGLTADGISSPSAYDPVRNPHRSGIAWSKAALRAILTNPRYTGRQVWNRQRKDEILLDVDDVALGYETRMRWNDPNVWIYSAAVVHPPLVDDETFTQVQARYNVRRVDPSGPREPKRTRHPYQLRGLMHCGICRRRMQGSWNNGKPHYRCVYPDQYALANHIHHPRSVYVREELIVPHLDRWLARVFTPPRLTATIDALTAAQDDDTDLRHDAPLAQARRTIADCDAKLERYRLALEAGTDPTLVARWTAKVNTERAAAQARLRASTRRQRMTKQEISDMVTTMGDIVAVLAEADPADKAETYTQLGLQLIYEPGAHRVIAEAKPQPIMYERECPRGDLNPHALRGH
ncbi:recombinase family protein [Frankia sp. Cas4]|uniref:recombinase family protein n=1 Tax=Frankia sp. Cas4 TaxID=3073927 RepID=UPI002AD2AD9D|nr:recombinase family protein [Frankia sp. Cas4]